MRVTLNEQSQSLWQSQHLEHLRYEYDLKPDDVVIDIGAYRGEWAEQILDRYGCKMIVVEPTDSITQYAAFAGTEVINKAAWLFDGKLRMGGAYYYTSAFEDPVTEYECFDINSLLRRFDDIALLKMNVEGAEYDLITHVWREGMLHHIHELQIQFHLIEGEQSEVRYDAVAALLGETHRVRWRYPFCWESWWPYRVG